MLATLWMQEPTERRRRCRAECPGHGSVKNALPAWMRNRCITCGAVPRQLAPSHGHRAYTCFLSDRQAGADCSAPTIGGQCRPTNRTDSREESSPAWFPTTRKESHHGAAASTSAGPNISGGCPPTGSPNHDHRYKPSDLHAFLWHGGPVLPGTKGDYPARRVLGMKRSHPDSPRWEEWIKQQLDKFPGSHRAAAG